MGCVATAQDPVVDTIPNIIIAVRSVQASKGRDKSGTDDSHLNLVHHTAIEHMFLFIEQSVVFHGKSTFSFIEAIVFHVFSMLRSHFGSSFVAFPSHSQ